ncbi:hypothetical protein CAEBREN_07408 [Caenorhabditis brenneri]|uniref:Uncharacterized protein n=1 Tax=Caenorhabditis brenneri TaxID=135651 RepID=G0MNK3_CAEBE|nr:hypothetical protein CAEBREN_07408 [Caenorhabditis brenneri]
MNPQPQNRRQRYFRPNSPPGNTSPSGVGNDHRLMNSSNLNVLEQAELVIDGGEEQQVSHEEIVDDGSTEMVVEHHHHSQLEQLRSNPIHHHHYESRQQSTPNVYQVQQQPTTSQSHGIRRSMGRTIAQRSTNYAQNPMDMVQKLQNKNVYMPQQRPQTRISPAGARIVSFAGRKRDNPEALPPGVKKMNMSSARQQPQSHHQGQSQLQVQQHSQHLQKNLQSVKVVRLASSSARTNPAAAENALIDIESNIKQTIEDSKIDVEKLRQLQGAELSQEDYNQYLGSLILDLERTNEANHSLINFYRDRQRHEKTIYEARENTFAARIRQLETENRKLREGIHALYFSKFNDAGGHNNLYRNDHMGQMMSEDAEEHVVIEGHDGNNQETEEVPQEWIVEETVDEHRMHMQELESEEHQHLVNEEQQENGDEETNDIKNKSLLVSNDQFRNNNPGGSS